MKCFAEDDIEFAKFIVFSVEVLQKYKNTNFSSYNTDFVYKNTVEMLYYIVFM